MMGGSWSTRREPMRALGEYAKSAQKAPPAETGEPFCLRVTVLTTTPPCSSK